MEEMQSESSEFNLPASEAKLRTKHFYDQQFFEPYVTHVHSYRRPSSDIRGQRCKTTKRKDREQTGQRTKNADRGLETNRAEDKEDRIQRQDRAGEK